MERFKNIENKILVVFRENERQGTATAKVLQEKGFENIVLAGHSAGAWASITLRSKFPENIDGVIALNPAVAGTLKNRKDWPWWEDIKNYLINLMELSDLTNLHHRFWTQ